MAPEQIRGESADHRSDLYSLGILLYQMALGRRPFEGENREAIWYAHATMEPPTPREIDPELPEPLSHIILNLLAKDPEDRYGSAARVVRHLRTLGLDGAARSLEPVDQLHVEQLRTRTLTPTALTGERTPIERPSPTQTHTQQDARPAIPAVPVDAESRKMMMFAGAAVLLVLAAAAWLVLGSRPGSAPSPAPPPVVKTQPAAAPVEEPQATQPAEPQPAPASPAAKAPEPPPAQPAGPSADEQEAARRAAEAARRRRAQQEARRQAEIEEAKARLRGESPAQPK
jgi:serine/threonine-protein kinase